VIRLLGVFVLVAVVAALAAWIAERPGLVVFEWQGWRAETSLWVLVVLVALLLTAVAVLDRVWRGVRRGRLFSSSRRDANRRRRGYLALTEGMAAVAAGDVEAAEKLARRARTLLEEPQASLLLTAQAAQLGGHETAAGRVFEAMLDHPETKFLGLRGLVAQALRRGDREAALGLARRAQALRPATPWVLSALLELESAAGHWAEAERALEAAVRHRAVASEAGRRDKALIMHERALAAERAGSIRDALALAERAVALAPGLAPLVAVAARLMTALGKNRRAARLIEENWALAPHPELARAYAALQPNERPAQRAARFETLTARQSDHEESRLALAEVALAAELWGLARSQLEALVATAPSARAGRLMASLERGAGNPNGARDWLARLAAAPPQAAWRCTACAETAAEFGALCPHCGQLGTLRWRAGERPPPPLSALDSGRDDQRLQTRLEGVVDDGPPADASGASRAPSIDADRGRGVA